MKRLFFLAVFLTCTGLLLCAKKPLRPKWLASTPEAGNSTYVFIPITVDARNITEGRNSALQQLVMDRNLLNSLRVQTDIKTISNIRSVDSTEGYSETTDFSMLSATTFTGESFDLKAQVVDYYYEPESQTYSSLYRVALVKNAVFDRIRVTSDYGFSAGWRSMVVPGWGQLYKGLTAKGVVFLGGTALLAGGAIFAETTRSNFMIQAGQTHDINLIRRFSANAQNMSTLRNVCAGALGAFYLYNVIDAFAARGAKRVVFPGRNGSSFISVVPQGFGGMSLYASTSF